MSAELLVLFGAGQVGQPLARFLLEVGKRVRIVDTTTLAQKKKPMKSIVGAAPLTVNSYLQHVTTLPHVRL